MGKIIIYTDGSSKGNPGPGGWAAIIIEDYNRGIMNYESRIKEIGGRENQTTNNRMEMKAAIEALKNTPSIEETRLRKAPAWQVEIHTDSEYLMKGATLWIKNWQKNNWRTKDKREVLNRDLWEELLFELEKRNVEWKKVLGHSGHALNERCDEIAQGLADGENVELYNGSKQGYKVFH